ncbi:MAG: hypothetical protein OXG04_21985 [Acidobacteria bacterium]|nr:hypothetical protein [Acidobacteriota bacterium]
MREQRAKAIFDASSPFGGQFFESCSEFCPDHGRPLNRGLHYQSRDRVEVVGEGRDANSECLERDAAATGGWIENYHASAITACLAERARSSVSRRVLERALVAVRIVHVDTGSSRPV